MPLFRRIVVSLLIVPGLALAQATPASVDSGSVHVRRDSVAVAPLDLGTAIAATRGHHARVGAVVGALAGATAGAIGSMYIGVGCRSDPCHATRTRFRIGLWFGSLGIISGGIVGAAVGALIPGGDADG